MTHFHDTISGHESEPPFLAQVFIDNPAGRSTKNLYNEKTLEYLRSVEVAASYPFPYGFFLGTTSGDGDNLDCFIITNRDIDQGETVTVEPVGVMEVIENDETDHKVLAQLVGEHTDIDQSTKDRLTQFIYEVFSDRPDKHMTVGNFLGQQEAVRMVLAAQDSEDTVTPDNANYDNV